ncbi:hypothetical protein SESBI_13145 [Sesbania bispinosa]|nr:hypothetical protein SESBI_13145 [Sesbania bispinosa]
MGGKVGWVSLNSIPQKGVLSDLLVGEDGVPHFPLFWSLAPRRVPGYDYNQLPFDEKIDVAFLQNCAPFDCGFLLENEDIPARLRQIIDKMPPKADVPRVLINEKAMRRWLKKAGGDSGAQTSGGNPTSSTNERRKKQKLDPKVPPASNPASSTTLSSPMNDKQWALFNNFEGPEGSDVASIFDHRFPVEQLITKDFNKKEDRTRVNRAGMRNVGKHLQTMGIQSAFFGYCIDNGLSSLDKELKDRALKIKDLSQRLQSVESSTQAIA